MTPLAWAGLGILAALLADLLIIQLARLRRSGRLTGLPALSWRPPRPIPPLLVLAGAASLFLGQSMEAPLPATGTDAAPWLTALGALAVIAGGALVPLVAGDAAAKAKQKGLNKIARKTPKSAKQVRGSMPNLELGALLLAAVVLLYLGSAMPSYVFEGERGWSYVYSALGLGCFMLAALGFSGRGLPAPVDRTLRSAADWLGVAPAQVVLLGLAPPVALSAWLAAGDSILMRQPALALVGWLAGIALVIVGGVARLPRLARPLVFTPEVYGLGGLFLLAFLLRGLATAQVPWLFTGDEASAGISAVQFIEGFRNNLFGVAWFSFPALFFFVQSIFVRVFGQTVEALRVLSALAGALTVPVTYALAKELFGKRVAWVSAGYLAVFHFHIHFSRIGLNNIWDGFFVAAFAAAFWWAWKRNDRLAFAGAGIVLGLSQYFYVSIRAVLPIFVLWLVAAALKDRDRFRRRLPGLSVLLLGLLVTALPLAIFFFKHPLEFQAPLGRVAALGPWLQSEAQNTGRSVWEVMLLQVRAAALGFTSVDLRLAYAPGQPMLLALPATLFLMGVSLLALRIRELGSIWIGLWLVAAIAVGALSLSPPASQRYILVAPAVAMLVALPLVTAAEWIAELWPGWRRGAWAGAALALALVAWSDLRFYFGDYATGTAFADINTETAQTLAEILSAEEPNTYVYFLGGRMGFRSHSNILYLAPQIQGQDLPEPLHAPLHLVVHPHTLFVLLPERRAELDLIQQAYPGGTAFERQGRHELLFVAYELGGS